MIHYGRVEIAEPAKFQIDGDPTDSIYEGWTNMQYWNGFGCPAFEKPVADLIMKNIPGTNHFDAKADAYIFIQEDSDEPDEPYEGSDIETTKGKKHVYHIGAFNWTWSELEENCLYCNEELQLAFVWRTEDGKDTLVPLARTRVCSNCSAMFVDGVVVSKPQIPLTIPHRVGQEVEAYDGARP